VNGEFNSHNRSSAYWDQYESERKLYRLGDTAELDPGDMLRQSVSAICHGIGLYIAYNWWGHAVELVGYRMSSSGELETLISNSHNEDDMLVLKG
jgi:hypothetical protein